MKVYLVQSYLEYPVVIRYWLSGERRSFILHPKMQVQLQADRVEQDPKIQGIQFLLLSDPEAPPKSTSPSPPSTLSKETSSSEEGSSNSESGGGGGSKRKRT